MISVYQISNIRIGNINQDILNDEIAKICQYIEGDEAQLKYVIILGQMFDKFHLTINDTKNFKAILSDFASVATNVIIPMNCQFPNLSENIIFINENTTLGDLTFQIDESTQQQGIALGFIPEEPAKWKAVMVPSIDGNYEINENIVYGVSVMQHNPEEQIEKGFIHWEFSEGLAIPKFIDLYCPRGYIKYILGDEIEFNCGDMDRMDMINPYFVQIESNSYNQYLRVLKEKYENIQIIHPSLYGDVDREAFIEEVLNGEDENIINRVKSKLLNNVGRKSQRKQIEFLYLSWSNLYCYGMNNYINFGDLKGNVSGLIAENKMGKSAIIDILVFVLYNHILRGDIKQILNKNAENGEVAIKLAINEEIHEIRRTIGEKPKIEYLINNTIVSSNVVDTYRQLNKMVGSYYDIISTSIMTQDKTRDFVSLSSLERLKLLGNMIGMDVLQEISSEVKRERLHYSHLIKDGIGNVSEEEINELKNKIDAIEEKMRYIDPPQNIILIKPSYKSEDLLGELYKIEEELKGIEVKPLQVLENTLKELGKHNPQNITLEENNFISKYEPLENNDDIQALYNIKAEIEKREVFNYGDVQPLLNYESRKDRYDEIALELNNYKEKLNPEYKNYYAYCNYSRSNVVQSLEAKRLIMELSKRIIPIEPVVPTRPLRDIEAEIKKMDDAVGSAINRRLQKELIFNEACINCRKNKSLLVPLYSKSCGYEELIMERRMAIEQLANKKINDTNAMLTKQIEDQRKKIMIDEPIQTLEFIVGKYTEIIRNNSINRQIKELETKLIYERRLKYTNYLKETKLDQLETICRKISYHLSVKRATYNVYINRVNTIKGEIEKAKNYERLKKDIIKKLELYKRVKSEESEYYDNLIQYEADAKARQEYNTLKIELDIHKKKLTEKFSEQVLADEYAKNLGEYNFYKLCEKCINYKNGLPVQYLMSSIHILTKEINTILMNVCDFYIEFDFNDKSKLSINVINEFHKVPIELSSGYQKFIISLAFRHAILKITERNIPNFIIIDEGFGCLDAENKRRVANIIPKFKYIYNFVIIISHTNSISQCIECPIEIKKIKPYSQVRFGEFEIPSILPPKKKPPSVSSLYKNGECLICRRKISAQRWRRHTLSLKHLKLLAQSREQEKSN